MRKMWMGLLYFAAILPLLVSLLAGCSASGGNEAAEPGASTQPGPPIITVYKAAT